MTFVSLYNALIIIQSENLKKIATSRQLALTSDQNLSLFYQQIRPWASKHIVNNE